LEDILFKFTKVGEEELVLADQLKDSLRKAREALALNFDQQDPQFITLREELERLFKKKKLNEVTQQEMNENIHMLNQIHEKVKELNRENNLLRDKYHGDAKYARIHKRLWEKGNLSDTERKIFEALLRVKQDADDKVLNNSQILENENYFERSVQPFVISRFMNEQGIKLNPKSSQWINHLIVNEYLNEFNGVHAW